MDFLKFFASALLNQKGFGNVTFNQLLNHASDIQSLYDCTFEYKELNYKDKFLHLINIAKSEIESEQAYLDKAKVKLKCVWESDYPPLLLEIQNPPVIIYYRGDWSLDKVNNCITIVGTRKPTDYGKRWAANFGEELSQTGYTIVSGMAFGVDRLAHEGALKNKNSTNAVLATSPDVPSPNTNSDVYKDILVNSGLIISETRPGTAIIPGLFAKRNTILAGISRATIVIEASKKSGSLITADLAFDYDRDVFALPGKVDSAFSFGTNQLIKSNKAMLVQSVDDVLDAIGGNKDRNSKKMELDLTAIQKRIYDQLAEEPRNIEELAVIMEESVSEIINNCTKLEIVNIVKKDFSGKYKIV